MIEATFDNILVEPIDEKTESGIELPGGKKQGGLSLGEVVHIGCDVNNVQARITDKTENDTIIVKLDKGDKIYYRTPMSPLEVEDGNKKYILLKTSEIIAKIIL